MKFGRKPSESNEDYERRLRKAGDDICIWMIKWTLIACATMLVASAILHGIRAL